ncbi:LAFA_0C02498g1_1 [Lachancea sp. 'fantastica']|nr:LAFA_0C02498g1_1 [Lachancea sp. 'fantastica']
MERSVSPSVRDVPSSSGSRLATSLSKLSTSGKQYHRLSANDSIYGISPKTSYGSRYTTHGFTPSIENVKEDKSADFETDRVKRYVAPGQIRSSGLKYSLQVSKELSSIDKINDPRMRSIVIAGKNHLGLYEFDKDTEKIRCVHDYLQNSGDRSGSVRTFKKISTISDVKTGFHNHKNYVATCGTSNSVSIYDINKANANSGPLATVLSKHTRSINSVDFNMSQTSLIISGGQDGCVKVWDLRSSDRHRNKSDITINSGSDSVRDVKWQPTFDTISYDSVPGLANRGHKFASIHDSGLLLTYDLRQPSQAENRINAHTGPGLCLSWHPVNEYIMTGGRDGKCCLWNVSVRNPNLVGNPATHQSNSFGSASTLLTPTYSINPTVTASDVLINTAHPLTKLKFRPSNVENVFNSVVALSSLGENSDVSLYSLSRPFVPKNVLTTTTPSCGFVWWDENFIFNIDKQNMITGWDLEREPTALDNLSKNVIGWRDIEGDGMLFVSQKRGGYEQLQRSSSDTPIDKHNLSQSRKSINSVHNLFSGSNLRQNSSTSSFSALGSQHGTSSAFIDRPSYPRSSTSHNFKNLHGPQLGSYTNQSFQHHDSIASISTSSTVADSGSEYISPRIISLDLPHLINRIMSSRSMNSVNKSNTADFSALKESPVEVFKFLARELKFSYDEEAPNTATDAEAHTPSEASTQSEDDIDIKTHLINQFGLAEDNTWTKFIRNAPHKDKDVNELDSERLPTDADTSAISFKSEYSSKTNLDKMDKSVHSKQNMSVEEKNVALARQKIEHFIELIAICDHNAETYLFVEDLSNFKIWMMLRDALLWDLKEVADKVKLDSSDFVSDVMDNSGNILDGSHRIRRSSEASEYSSFSASEIVSAQHSNSLSKHGDSLNQDNLSRATSSQNIKAETLQTLDGDHERMPLHLGSRRTTSEVNASERGIGELRKQQSLAEEYDDAAIEEECGDGNESQGNKSQQQMQGIPILPSAGRRISFVDNFINNLRSPKGTHDDRGRDSDSNTNRTTHSFTSKRSAPPSFGSSLISPGSSKPLGTHSNYYANSFASLEEPSEGSFRKPVNLNEALGINLSPDSGTQHSRISQMLKNKKQNEVIPPWDSSKLIKKHFDESVENGNVLLTVAIILLFQTTFRVTSTSVVKNALAEFFNVLHKYELFETAADLVKFCPWDDILGSGTGQCTVRIYCEKCKKLLVNERSKEKFMNERKQTGNADVMRKFGYWYCDACSRRNTLCSICERPLKKLAMCALNCGHMGHFECLQNWFLHDQMDSCPCGCPGKLI